MSFKSFIPGTLEHSRRHHQKYLQKRLGGHDHIAQVEWADGTITDVPVNYRPEDNKLVADNGLQFSVKGRAGNALSYHGVPVIRTHALIPCPFDATSCIHAELDEESEYTVYTYADDGPQVERTAATAQEAVTDGGIEQNGAGTDIPFEDGPNGFESDRIYNMQPPDGCVGWAFSLQSMGERAVNSISGADLKDSEERGKQSQRNSQEWLRALVIGAGGVLGVIFVIAVLAMVFIRVTGVM